MSHTMWSALIVGVCLIVLVFFLSPTRIHPSTVGHTPTTSATSTTSAASSSDEVQYADPAHGVSFSYPRTMTLDTTYTILAADTHTQITGVRLFVPTSMATGTNLAADSYVSVEYGPQNAQCTPETFLDHTDAPTATVDENTAHYLVASSTDAGAGNRYEQVVYVPQAGRCIAVRYFIHYAVIENYPPGVVTAFDEAAVLRLFDRVRDSVVVS